jgi:DNA-binding PadR family transcriptional regulator
VGLTPAEMALLGLLAERPQHGYELEEVIKERGMREWTEIGFSSIYYLLTKLRERGLLAETQARQARGKPRKVYAPTEAGLHELAQAAEAAIATLHPVYPPILLGLANQPLIPAGRLRTALAARASAIAERMRAIRAASDAQPGKPDFADAIFDYSLGQLAAENDWLIRYQARLKGTAMTAYDVKKELKQFYAPRNRDWQLIDVPPMRFIGVKGKGNPNSSGEYAGAVASLYAVSYAVKFASKAAGKDLVVGPLEGLWWADDPSVFTARAKDSWHWEMLISQPEWVDDDMIAAAKKTALDKKKLPVIERVALVELHEGRSAQVLHLGSYEDETPVLARLHHEFFEQHKLDFNGLHHEIYLSDPRRTDPSKLKTVLRQPVRSA